MPSLTVRAAASASTTAKAAFTAGSNLKIVGIVLAITSGLLIGSSFVFKKKGLLSAQAGHTAGEGVAYLKSPLWWIGMTMMILGELCNFAAYAFVEAIVVTPLGALSVVVCAILSSIFLKEKLTFFGWLGCVLSILGSVIIALNGPTEASVGQIVEFQKLFLSVGFLVYAGILITAALVIIFYAAPRWGKKSMLWYIFVCSMIGGISVSVTTGLGAAIVTTAAGDNQFKHWFIYFLFGFVAITLITEVYYLNVALALFNTVTPTYYVIFTFFSILTTIVLFKGLSAPVSGIITLVMGFLMSKVDPTEFKQLDRRSTILLQAARSHTETFEEKPLAWKTRVMDALRGSFGTVGSIIRCAHRPAGAGAPFDRTGRNSTNPRLANAGMQRHQLYDAPMPGIDLEARSQRSDSNATSPGPGIAKRTTIKFDAQDVVHQYHPTGGGGGTPRRDDAAIHAFRPALPSPGLPSSASELDDPAPPSNLRIAAIDAGRGAAEREHATADALAAGCTTPTGQQVRGSPQSGTLLSFPSVTDSARSANWEDGAPAGSGSTPGTPGRGRGQKKYPKTAGDDDREESVSLWQRGQSGRDSEEDAPIRRLEGLGGIRLVQPRF
ncbi:magnesium transporter NIPA-domain-containing protein [Mycena alexandri]|uniref:Magnesium transporter NIPA-domain-containing protein n=1 Tax=Mycena alexandri TaxID=1745969 RepID=A0AAD6X3P6_9AGAR|nr:magnesium transporter NIPA-domain-containing protein [Mycena alexandri]